jgi:predicted NBD/HSP70 family sugar kinase
MSAEPPRPNRHTLIRRHNESLVLNVIGSSDQPVGNATIVDQTGLSRPTVNVLIDDLCNTGLIQEAGIRTGFLGRPASLVELNPEFAAVVAIAVDSTSITVAISDLTAHIRCEVRQTLRKSASIVDAIDKLLDACLDQSGFNSNRIRAYCVSEPGVSSSTGVPRALAPNVPELHDAWLQKRLNSRNAAPILFENDVNLAAIGEQRFGIAKGEPSFAFLMVDTGIGMGLIVNGDVWRGVHGAAGEAGYLPIGEGRLTGRAAKIGSLELHAGSRAFLSRFREATGKSRATVSTVLNLAVQGDGKAQEVIHHEADLVSRAVLSTVALLDPAFVVLGGEIGSHQLVADAVRSRMKSIAPYPVDVRISTLGERAPVLGALATALDVARQELVLPTISKDLRTSNGIHP